MKSAGKNWELRFKLNQRRIDATLEQCNILRLAEKTLHRWAELECGTDHGCIERDESTGKSYWLNAMTGSRYPIADRESGALKRVDKMCKELGIHYYHQNDPRGVALYVSRRKLTDRNYTDGLAVCVD